MVDSESVFIIVVCYGIMIWRLHHRNSENIHLSTQQGMISKTKIRTIQLLLIVVIVYIMCWAPCFICFFLQEYKVPVDELVMSAAYAVAPLNSITNPLVFLIFNRKMFKKKDKNGKRYGKN